jgi:hypothetical protein
LFGWLAAAALIGLISGESPTLGVYGSARSFWSVALLLVCVGCLLVETVLLRALYDTLVGHSLGLDEEGLSCWVQALGQVRVSWNEITDGELKAKETEWPHRPATLSLVCQRPLREFVARGRRLRTPFCRSNRISFIDGYYALSNAELVRLIARYSGGRVLVTGERRQRVGGPDDPLRRTLSSLHRLVMTSAGPVMVDFDPFGPIGFVVSLSLYDQDGSETGTHLWADWSGRASCSSS